MGIDVLGPVQVGDSSWALGRRDRVLVSALALEHGEVLSPDRLADALWGEEPPKSWPKVVQGSMSRLRRALGPQAIETTSGGYRLCVDDDDIDALRFEQLVTRARGFVAVHEPARAVTAYERALALWRGPAFGELEGWDAGRAEAARLLEVRLTAEEELVAARMAMGGHAESVAEARRLTAREPYRERRWALLALALYRCGNQQEALTVLRRAGNTLRDELGLDPGAELVELEQSLLRQDPDLRPVPTLASSTSSGCPYRGLRAYGSGDSETFFGRDEAVATCLARLRESPLLLVAGPSGSGKSSLLAAGVVPALLRAGHAIVQLTPGAHPLVGLTGALAGESETAVVVVDQLEELFGAPSAEVNGVLELLVSRAASGAPVLVGLRADHLGDLAASPAFARQAERGLVLVTPMTEAELQLAIEAPALRNGLLLEPGLIDLLIRDVLGEPGGLPLLSHALAETWERREGNVLTVEGYAQTGGIRGAVSQSAERLYGSLSGGDQEALRTVLLRLVAPNPIGEPLGVHVSARVFTGSPDVQRLLDVLVRARLVTADAESVAIAHESLVRAWPRLRGWLDDDVDGQRVLQHLQTAAEGWDLLGRPAEELYRGARLRAACEWRDRVAPMLSETEVSFLDESEAREDEGRRHEQLRLKQQLRRNRQLRAALVGVVGLLAVALVTGTLAADNSRKTRTAATAADAARLGSDALTQSSTDLSLLLARQSVALADTPSTEGSLLETLARQRGLVGVVAPGSDFFGGGFFDEQMVSDDGRRLLMSSSDGALLLDTSTGRPVGRKALVPAPDDFADWPYTAGLTDSGRTAVVSRVIRVNGTKHVALQAFSTQDGQAEGGAVVIPDARVTEDWFDADRLRISPDGSVLVSLLHRTIRVWHRAAAGWTGPQLLALPAFPTSLPESDRLADVSFSRDGSRAALVVQLQGPRFGQPPRLGFVIDTARPRLVMPVLSPTADDYAPTSLALSPQGDRIALGHADGRVTIHEIAAPGASVDLPGTAWVGALGWQGDGGRLAVGDNSGSITVYDGRRLTTVATYPATGDATVVAALRGHLLISQSGLGAITVRSLDDTNGLMTVVPTPFNNALAASADGATVVTGGDGGNVRIYAGAALSRPPMVLTLGPYATPDPSPSPAERRRVSALAISRDGRTLVAADRLGHLRQWALPSGRLLWSRDDVPVSFLALSPDGRWLGTSGFTQPATDLHPDSTPISTTVTLWSLSTHRALLTDKQTGTTDEPNTPKPRSIAFSPDSSLLAAGFFDPPVRVYDVAKRAKRLTLDEAAAALTFTPDGGELVVQDFDAGLHGYDPSTGKQVESFVSPTGGYTNLAFTGDGRWLVGSDNTDLHVWDARSRRVIVGRLPLPSDGTNDALFLAATRRQTLLVATQTSLVSIRMDSGSWNRLACTMAGRTLTQAEWSRFLPGRHYLPACP